MNKKLLAVLAVILAVGGTAFASVIVQTITVSATVPESVVVGTDSMTYTVMPNDCLVQTVNVNSAAENGNDMEAAYQETSNENSATYEVSFSTDDVEYTPDTLDFFANNGDNTLYVMLCVDNGSNVGDVGLDVTTTRV